MQKRWDGPDVWLPLTGSGVVLVLVLVLVLMDTGQKKLFPGSEDQLQYAWEELVLVTSGVDTIPMHAGYLPTSKYNGHIVLMRGG